MLVNPGGPGEPGRSLARRRRRRARARRWRPTTTSSGFDPRGVGGSVARAQLRPELLQGRAAGLHPGQRGGRAGADRPGEGLRRRVRAAVRLVPAVRDDGEHGARHGPDPPGLRRQAADLLRLLLRHLPRPGLRHAVPRPGAPDGARLHRGPDRRVVRRQHQPGLRLPGPARGVLRLDREVRLHLPPGQHRGAGRRRPTTRCARQLAKAPGRRAGRPDDRPGRARRHDPARRVPEHGVARRSRRRSPQYLNNGEQQRAWSPSTSSGARRARTRSRSTTRSSAPT